MSKYLITKWDHSAAARLPRRSAVE
jgi:hypothetical protein